MAPDRPVRRVIIVNPDEPKTGDFAYEFYEKSHPEPGRGDPETIARLKKDLAGLRGERIVMLIKGKRIDPETEVTRRFEIKRVVNFYQLRSVFGPGSAYASAIHYLRDNHSKEELVVTTLSIDVADDDDDDSEAE